MQEELARIERAALQQVESARSLDELNQIRAQILGKKGQLGQVLRKMGSVPAEERPKLGQTLNELKERIQSKMEAVALRIDEARQEEKLKESRFDMSLPGRRRPVGNVHPLRLIEKRCVAALERMGFQVASGPLIEHDWYNFEALNIPATHPARDMQDTFFLGPQVVLRTHTSNVQARVMSNKAPPVRIVAPGMVFRKDDVDATHSPVFHQLEGLWIDHDANFASLKGVLEQLVMELFGDRAQIRFRPSYFPFTEPSAEVDVAVKEGQWLEILGAGMVHPAVLRAVGYDTSQVQGFAFGLGLERIAMLVWGIDDIRLFYENDMRFLAQFASEGVALGG